MKRKLTAMVLTLGFCLSLTGGAFANTATTIDTANQPVVQAPVTTTTTPETISTTPETISTTPETISIPKVVNEKTYPGYVKEITGATITLISVNKKQIQSFVLDNNAKFIYKGKIVAVDKIGANSRVNLTYQVLSDKTIKVTKVQIVKLEAPKKITKKPAPKKPVQQKPVPQKPVPQKPVPGKK